MSSPVPRTFRRESRLFLWIALLLVLFLNLLTLALFRRAVEWGSASFERRAVAVFGRLSVSAERSETARDAALSSPELAV